MEGGAVSAGQTLKNLTAEKCMKLRIIFNKNKLAHTTEIFKGPKI